MPFTHICLTCVLFWCVGKIDEIQFVSWPNFMFSLFTHQSNANGWWERVNLASHSNVYPQFEYRHRSQCTAYCNYNMIILWIFYISACLKKRNTYIPKVALQIRSLSGGQLIVPYWCHIAKPFGKSPNSTRRSSLAENVENIDWRHF